ncbi:ATP-dependent DNA helicase RecG [Parcubacteria bacterium DG_74_3]|nr:MAG: ATP-dependent DNA helicase RecG [Parcubacteria bacterium DG_74_3]
MNLNTPVQKIPRIGVQYQKKLKKLGIQTVRDLLWHLPHRYEDFSNIIPVSETKIGENVCVKGEITQIENTRTWKKKIILTRAIVKDTSGLLKVVWFNQPYLTNVLKTGDFVCLAGKIAQRPEGLYLSSPAYEKISKIKSQAGDLIHTGRLVPVYPETERLSSRWLRYILKPLLVQLREEIQDPLPEEIKKEYKLLDLKKSLWQIHFPDSRKLAKKAAERFSFEELFVLSLVVLRERMRLAREKAISVSLNLEVVKRFVDSLPFKLTNAQKKSTWQILKDLERERPMNRLLEGDVGSGKTIVAVIAALNVCKSNFQVAFMAPTEILANQHFQEISKLLKSFKVKIGLLTGKENKICYRGRTTNISRKKLLQKLKGKIDSHHQNFGVGVDILIGTHALIQGGVKFGLPPGGLALVILDEQHRFGVEQRARLCQQPKLIPHLLSMTATPIPRTLALTVYGDLDLSLIDEMPKGRKKIITRIVNPSERKTAYNFIKKQVKSGRQVFVICPRIEPASAREQNKVRSWADVRAVKEEYKKLSKDIFPDLRIEMLHGRMKSDKKEKIMQEFKAGKINVLVATSVVEVGIDVPNATVMMIEGVERFGLAQLHQFRGRVGRGKYRSFCFLFTESPAKKTRLRLKALISSENGFKLAEKDLEIRGPGEFSGARQWGIPDLQMASLKNVFWVERARRAAKELLSKDPGLKKYPLLQERLKDFREKVHLE